MEGSQPSESQVGASQAERLEFETLISDTSAALMLATGREVKAAIETAVSKVRAFFRADRCVLLTVQADRRAVNVTAGSYASGVMPVGEEINLAELFPWSYQKLVVEGTAIRGQTAHLPPEAAADRANRELLGIKSFLTVPIFAGAEVTHLVVLNSVAAERDWPVGYLPRLRLLGDLMVAAVHRQKSFDKLEAAHNEVKRLRDRLEQENIFLLKEAQSHAGDDLVAGRSPVIRRALDLAAQVATTNATVLLVGETGTGKERFATYIHQASARAGRHMVRVNCSAIPSALMESELFGREKGAYTGALSKQIGRFELAHGSTLFLDEIGDLPLEVQVKLLRVLQERTIERLGSPVSIPVDVRIIAATNSDLEASIRAGAFRSDLYYRLNVFPIVVPPLRERREDIPALVETLVEELSTDMRKRIDSVDRASIEALTRYHWPGNIRELRNVLERAMILASGPTLFVAAPPSAPSVPSPASAAPAAVTLGAMNGHLDLVERDHILRVLEDTGWRIRGRNAAADVLGLKPTTLEARMARLGIHRPQAHGHE